MNVSTQESLPVIYTRQPCELSISLLDYDHQSRKRARKLNSSPLLWHHFWGPALWTETSLWSLVFDEVHFSPCVILFLFTPARGSQACRAVRTCWSQRGAVPTGTKGPFTLWKANRGGWWEAMCQGTEQILRDSGSRSALGLLGKTLPLLASRREGHCCLLTLCQKD